MKSKESKEQNVREALRLLGWAQFNLTKGKTEATTTLVDKAIVALGGEPIYQLEEEDHE